MVEAGHVVIHGRTVAVREVSTWRSARGRVTALMGRNGSGKSSLLWALQGSGRRRDGDDPDRRPRSGRPQGTATPPGRRAAAETVHRRALPRDRRRGVRGGWSRDSAPSSTAGARHRGRHASPRPVRGTAAGPRSCPRSRCRAERAAPRRADPRPRLRREGRAGRHPAPAGRRGSGRCWWRPTTWSSSRGPPTRWSCWPTARSCPGSGTPRGGRVAGVRATGHQGARATVATGGRGRGGDGDGVTTHLTGRAHAVPITPRSAAVLGTASVAGLMMLCWPLLLRVNPGETRIDPPFVFLALLPVVIFVVLAELQSGRHGHPDPGDPRGAQRHQRDPAGVLRRHRRRGVRVLPARSWPAGSSGPGSASCWAARRCSHRP